MEELLKSLQELLAIESVARRDQESPSETAWPKRWITRFPFANVWAFIQRTPTGCTAMRKSAMARRSSAALAIWTWSPREMAGIIRLMPEP